MRSGRRRSSSTSPYRPVLKAVCGAQRGSGQGVRRQLGLRVGRDRLADADRPQGHRRRSTSHSPNNTHREIAIAAAKAGKMVMCEKPLAMDRGRRPRRWSTAVEKAGVPNTVWYNYRRVPAVTLVKQLIDEGKLGRIFHYRANFLQDWTISTDLPQGGEGLWRLDVAVAGSGVTGDLLAHYIDTALWLNGPITEVTRDDRDVRQGAQAQPHGQGRAGRDRRRQRVPVPVRERLARHCSKSPATRAGTRRSTRFEINGEHASRSGTCTTCTASSTSTTATKARVRGWRSVHVTDGDHPYMKHWWVPGLQIGYEHTFIHQFADFVEAAAERPEPGADVPRRPGHRLRDRCGVEIGEDETVGEGRIRVDRRPETRQQNRGFSCAHSQ